ncbi:hypothetical protein NDU88_000508 [Pleurodeles waltl]|uniref:Uncharacterized protein n=1 Tax=Pleurodeles waltl TaxID=8319 RepID=A0AAV7SWS0_PLEWA|nr:hypothetical protein NDU88_000508 [Pleurodeles waltl]
MTVSVCLFSLVCVCLGLYLRTLSKLESPWLFSVPPQYLSLHPSVLVPGYLGAGSGSLSVPRVLSHYPSVLVPGYLGAGSGSPAGPQSLSLSPGSWAPRGWLWFPRGSSVLVPGYLGAGSGSLSVPRVLSHYPSVLVPGYLGAGSGSPAGPQSLSISPGSWAPRGWLWFPRGSSVLVPGYLGAGSSSLPVPQSLPLSPGSWVTRGWLWFPLGTSGPQSVSIPQSWFLGTSGLSLVPSRVLSLYHSVLVPGHLGAGSGSLSVPQSLPLSPGSWVPRGWLWFPRGSSVLVPGYLGAGSSSLPVPQSLPLSPGSWVTRGWLWFPLGTSGPQSVSIPQSWFLGTSGLSLVPSRVLSLYHSVLVPGHLGAGSGSLSVPQSLPLSPGSWVPRGWLWFPLGSSGPQSSVLGTSVLALVPSRVLSPYPSVLVPRYLGAPRLSLPSGPAPVTSRFLMRSHGSLLTSDLKTEVKLYL